MPRYGMVIDLKLCVGCGTCILACKMEHFLPPGMVFSRVLIKEHGEYPRVQRTMQPVLCNHCTDAACVKVCPSGATTRRPDGLVTVDPDKCIGCRYCMMACPYGSRSFYSKETGYYPGLAPTQLEKIGRERLQTGVVMKCDFCQERIDRGVSKGLRPGVDRGATPICVNNCPAKARHFGDLDNPASNVRTLITVRHGFQLHPEFGTDPSVYYVR
ncbi:MAG: 4Fe-4S dicluster domain-containing protein [Chloroflexi bacterium]|nr:4Fe-4S dicluster domain-containing protein [Chloroflexota bacterium]